MMVTAHTDLELLYDAETAAAQGDAKRAASLLSDLTATGGVEVAAMQALFDGRLPDARDLCRAARERRSGLVATA